MPSARRRRGGRRRRTTVPGPAGVVDCATSPTSVTNRRAPPADHPQRDRGMVLRLVDDDVAVGERCAVEHRVRLVDQQLIGRPSTSAACPRAGQELVDELDRLLCRPRLVDRRLQRAGLRPRVVAAGALQQLALRERPQAFLALVDRDRAGLGGREPSREHLAVRSRVCVHRSGRGRRRRAARIAATAAASRSRDAVGVNPSSVRARHRRSR